MEEKPEDRGAWTAVEDAYKRAASYEGSALQNLRALLAWLGISERVAATELGVSQPTLQSILNGSRVPGDDMACRIEVMSRRWSKGYIPRHSWPTPAVGPQITLPVKCTDPGCKAPVMPGKSRCKLHVA